MTSLGSRARVGSEPVVSTEPEVFELPRRFRTLGGRVQLFLKRIVDVAGASIGIVGLFPLLVVIGAALWFDSGRPILYRWNVVGRRGRYFTGYKFRTMVRDAEQRKAALADHNEMSGPMFKMRDDPRVTRVGRILRRFSLDELPQLWCVLKGDMSLVGPRPPLQTEWEQFSAWQRGKLAVTPGITCLWQVSGRADITNFDDWVKLDLDYIERWSLALDIAILFRTLAAVVARRGAY